MEKCFEPFCTLSGHMFYKNKSSVISSKERQQGMMHDIHVGITNYSKAKINVSYQGMDMQLKKKLRENFPT